MEKELARLPAFRNGGKLWIYSKKISPANLFRLHTIRETQSATLSTQEIFQRLMKLIRCFQMGNVPHIGQLYEARTGNLRSGSPC